MVESLKKNINSKSASSLIYFIAKGSFLGIATTNMFRVAKTSTYISSILGFLLSLIPFAIIMYILKNTKGEGIIDTIEDIFGKKLGKVINIIISIFFFLYAVILIYNFISFLNIEYMPETQKIYIGLLLILLFSYMLSKGISTLCRASQQMVYISVFILILTILGSFSNIEFENLFPIFEGGIEGIMHATLIYAIFSSLPVFLITIIGNGAITDDKNYIKSCIKYYVITNVVLILIVLICLLTLGINVATFRKYPEYVVLTQVNIFDILERVQNLFSIQLCFNVIILILCSLTYSFKTVKRCIKNTMAIKVSAYILPIILIIAGLNIFPNITEANMFYTYKLPYVFGIGMTIIILTIFFRILYLKKKNKY